NRSCVLTLALLSVATGCSSPPSIVAQVKAPGNLDKLWILVRDNKAPGQPLVLSKVEEDASKGGSLRFDGDGVRITVDVAAPGEYGLILIGWSGDIACLEHAASVFDGGLGSLGDGGAPGVGAGAQYFFARSVDVNDITTVDATMYTVDRKSGSPDD